MSDGETVVVKFTKFDGGNIVGAAGTLVSSDGQHVVLEHEGRRYKFQRMPGSKCGWGTQTAKHWRLDMDERKAYCEKDYAGGTRK